MNTTSKTVFTLCLLIMSPLALAQMVTLPIIVNNLTDQTLYVDAAKCNTTPNAISIHTIYPQQQHVRIGTATADNSTNYDLDIIVQIGGGAKSYLNTSLVMLNHVWAPMVYIGPVKFTVDNKDYAVSGYAMNTPIDPKGLAIQITQKAANKS